jgi:hypothetical protein
MPGNDKNKGARAERIRKIMAGLQKHFASANLTLAGTSFTPSALQAFLQADVDANDASTLAREKWLTTVQSARETDAKTNPVVRAIESQVKAVYGEAQNAGDILAEFGFSPRKRVVMTADTKAAAAAKVRATRAKRGTMGKRQKAKVKGTPPRRHGPGRLGWDRLAERQRHAGQWERQQRSREPGGAGCEHAGDSVARVTREDRRLHGGDRGERPRSSRPGALCLCVSTPRRRRCRSSLRREGRARAPSCRGGSSPDRARVPSRPSAPRGG